MENVFGGDWTKEKLERLKKYLDAYVVALKKATYFNKIYIDAFAGTGYTTLKQEDSSHISSPSMFDELIQEDPLFTTLLADVSKEDTQKFLDGSTRIALQVEPTFDEYIFIEKSKNQFVDLHKLKVDFPNRKDRIKLVNADANSYLQALCVKRNWAKTRAVVFLDPFGMQVEWATIEAIARTKAIDLWLLFPLGIAVNRLLKRDGNINLVLRQRLDKFFGATNWYEAFYTKETMYSLFDTEEIDTYHKTADHEAIGKYFIERLKTIFAGVADNPLLLCNSLNSPLYLLCFAAANPNGAKTAIKIAQDILKKR